MGLVVQLGEGPFRESLDTLLSTEVTTAPEQLLAAGDRRNIRTYFLRAFHRRICGDPEAAKALRKAISDAKVESVRLVDPTPAGISFGSASALTIAIGTLFPGPIAVAAAPLIGSIAFLLVLAGIDAFCEWAKSDEVEQSMERLRNKTD